MPFSLTLLPHSFFLMPQLLTLQQGGIEFGLHVYMFSLYIYFLPLPLLSLSLSPFLYPPITFILQYYFKLDFLFHGSKSLLQKFKYSQHLVPNIQTASLTYERDSSTYMTAKFLGTHISLKLHCKAQKSLDNETRTQKNMLSNTESHAVPIHTYTFSKQETTV